MNSEDDLRFLADRLVDEIYTIWRNSDQPVTKFRPLVVRWFGEDIAEYWDEYLEENEVDVL